MDDSGSGFCRSVCPEIAGGTTRGAAAAGLVAMSFTRALSCGQICAAMVQVARRSLRQTGATKNIFAIAVMLHLRAPYDSKTAILGCWVDCSGQKSKSRLNSKDLDRLVSS